MTHIPVGLNPAQKYPLVLAFHGGQQGATQSQLGWIAIAYESKLNQKSDSAKFFLVYPEGSVINGNRTWNAGDCCPPANINNVNDVGFVDSLLKTLYRKYKIDTTRVYATGSSNGAMLCFRLACELSNRIAAIATVSATHMFTPCNPSRKIPIINFHSYVDSAVIYTGGLGVGPSGVYFSSQDSTMNLWKRINNCSSKDTVVNGHGVNYDLIRIHDCDCNVEFDQYNTTDGGHSWPGGNPNNWPVSTQINATTLLWQFLTKFTLDTAFTAIKDEEPVGTIKSYFLMQNYPNPFNPVTTISYQIPATGVVSLKVHDVLGNEVATLVNEVKQAGTYNVLFRGTGLASGMYYYQLKACNYICTKKCVLLK